MKKRITSKQYLTMCLGECFGTFLPACETDQVDKNIALAKELYITSTPTLIMPDGHVFPGYKKASGIVKISKVSLSSPSAD